MYSDTAVRKIYCQAQPSFSSSFISTFSNRPTQPPTHPATLGKFISKSQLVAKLSQAPAKPNWAMMALFFQAPTTHPPNRERRERRTYWGWVLPSSGLSQSGLGLALLNFCGKKCCFKKWSKKLFKKGFVKKFVVKKFW